MRPLDLDIPYHPGPEHLVAAEWRHLEPTLGQLCEAFGHHMIDDLHCPWDRTVHIEKVEAPWQLGFMSQVLQLLRARAPRFRAALIGSVPALTAVIYTDGVAISDAEALLEVDRAVEVLQRAHETFVVRIEGMKCMTARGLELALDTAPRTGGAFPVWACRYSPKGPDDIISSGLRRMALDWTWSVWFRTATAVSVSDARRLVARDTNCYAEMWKRERVEFSSGSMRVWGTDPGRRRICLLENDDDLSRSWEATMELRLSRMARGVQLRVDMGEFELSIRDVGASIEFGS